ncbi:MAG: DsrE family protein [Longimicrobiales bacterium]|nr:DsrE family protein [Longimicrobiales bacterium]
MSTIRGVWHIGLIWALAAAQASAPALADAQERATRSGPVIQSAGAVFQVDPDVETPSDVDYRVAFDVATPAPSPDRLNPSLNTPARFLNMHAQAGVPEDRLAAALVVHGGASFELLDDEAYRSRFGVDNPNGDLLRELIAKGHPVILCGQSAASRNVPTDQLIPGVEVALSAMTAFVILQEQGYRVNPW